LRPLRSLREISLSAVVRFHIKHFIRRTQRSREPQRTAQIVGSRRGRVIASHSL
jgi:hypothetical protein